MMSPFFKGTVFVRRGRSSAACGNFSLKIHPEVFFRCHGVRGVAGISLENVFRLMKPILRKFAISLLTSRWLAWARVTMSSTSKAVSGLNIKSLIIFTFATPPNIFSSTCIVVSIARNPPKGGLSRFFEQVLGKRYKVIGGRKRRIVKADEIT